ncbi:hypothetical protein AX289_30330 [Methylorubrum populi]|nr:hypothetical protein AX289_30330 [Methylorubrum populi]
MRGGDQNHGQAGGNGILGQSAGKARRRGGAGTASGAAEQRTGHGPGKAGQRTDLGGGAAPGEHPATDGAEGETERERRRNAAVGCERQLGHYCTALRLGMGGPNKATQALDITTDNTERFKTIWGIRLNGLNLASDALIGLDSSTKYGILSNLIGLANPTFSEAMIGDASVSSKTTLQATGSRTQSVIDTQGVTIAPQGGSPTAVVMAAGQQVCFAGFNVCWRYDTTAKRMKLRWNGQDVASIDSGGNARFLGAVTGNTTP